jgi:hypothetical protein
MIINALFMIGWTQKLLEPKDYKAKHAIDGSAFLE